MDSLELDFNAFVQKEIYTIKKLYNQYKTDKNTKLQKDYANKYPFLKRKSRYPFLDEILSWQSTKDKFDSDYDSLLKILIAKITGIYKHGQTDKTSLCNLRIISNVRLGKFSIAISKNTLDAKNQWEARLIKDLKSLYPNTDLKDIILIISSKFNDMGGNATHCKSVRDAIAHYTMGNYKIMFICSNKRRVTDILDFMSSYEGMSDDKRLDVEVQHDEAHNNLEGIPSKRELIENIIINPYVKSYIPISASNNPISDETRVLWKLKNLEMYAIDYTKNSQTLSTSENYSSISDANQLSFEEFKQHPSYKDYQITEFDEETFEEADTPGFYSGWVSEEEIKVDKLRRRQLEFCKFMMHEKEACNIGMNLLDNFYISMYKEEDGTIVETPLILADTRNIHIVTTPCRVVFTIHLIKYALKQSYNPICIGLYRSEIHLHYKNKLGQSINKPFGEITDTCSSEQMNDKINTILEYVLNQGETIERPILIMGNIKTTGESITFVNYKYGTIRTDTILPAIGQTREDNYQSFLRCCYMDTKFRENSPGNVFRHPPKWIIGSKNSIKDAISYEKENDERIPRLKEGMSVELLTPIIARTYTEEDNSNISVPCRLQIQDPDDESYHEIRAILEQSKRSEKDKKKLLKLIKFMIDHGSAEFVDTTGKFCWKKMILKDIRTWKTHSEEEINKRKEEQKENYKPFETDYRFREYDSRYRNKIPYINNKLKMGVNNCELLAAFDTYKYEGFVNHKLCMWISYRFE